MIKSDIDDWFYYMYGLVTGIFFILIILALTTDTTKQEEQWQEIQNCIYYETKMVEKEDYDERCCNKLSYNLDDMCFYGFGYFEKPDKYVFHWGAGEIVTNISSLNIDVDYCVNKKEIVKTDTCKEYKKTWRLVK